MTLCHGQSRAEGKGGPLSQLPFPFPTQVAVSESTNVSTFEIGNLAKESAKTMGHDDLISRLLFPPRPRGRQTLGQASYVQRERRNEEWSVPSYGGWPVMQKAR